MATKAMLLLADELESGTLFAKTPPTKLFPLAPTGTTVVVLKIPPGANVTLANVCVTMPKPMKGVNVVVAPPRLVNVTTPLTVVLALAVPGNVMPVLIFDSKGVSSADEKLLLVLISGTVLVPKLPLTMPLVVPTNNTVLVANTALGASVTGGSVCVKPALTMTGVKVVVALPKFV